MQEGADEDTGDDAPPVKAPRSRWLDEEQDEEAEAPLNKVCLLAALHHCVLRHTVCRCGPLCCTSDARGTYHLQNRSLDQQELLGTKPITATQP